MTLGPHQPLHVFVQMVEISRVLQPRGVFVASTFLKTFSPLGEFLGDDTVRPLNQVKARMWQHTVTHFLKWLYVTAEHRVDLLVAAEYACCIECSWPHVLSWWYNLPRRNCC